MARFYAILAALIVAAILCLVMAVSQASAHAWYTKKVDPVYNQSCCGGNDCAQLVIEPGVLTAEENGYRIRLTLEQAQKINKSTIYPIDAVVEWNRVQPSEDGNYHLCIMTYHRDNARGGIYCLFAPPNM